mmetsp:Transcript_104142/g.300115  ORF Transcript_104142/g.300115 Transcript_104142/m.300115 type:complete len:219 (-) Transcript_104142:1032-1688(-)
MALASVGPRGSTSAPGSSGPLSERSSSEPTISSGPQSGLRSGHAMALETARKLDRLCPQRSRASSTCYPPVSHTSTSTKKTRHRHWVLGCLRRVAAPSNAELPPPTTLRPNPQPTPRGPTPAAVAAASDCLCPQRSHASSTCYPPVSHTSTNKTHPSALRWAPRWCHRSMALETARKLDRLCPQRSRSRSTCCPPVSHTSTNKTHPSASRSATLTAGS